ncbi:mapk-regulated corepressor-interacting protein 1 isoform X1 [Chlorocebus sabaeus]|uniref:mapk-regulated corepressor-interacting protein 1 isoform X1 n=1 Tax=Chlorocebus sabaeus TaxID=60711 RepID=UPI003BF97867
MPGLFFFFFGHSVLLCCLDWSAVPRSWLTAALTSWAQSVLPPQPPSRWDYKCMLPHQRLRGSGGGALGSDAPAMTSSPVSRVVYNGKRTSSPRSPPSSSEIFTPAHEENVRFIYEAWQGVERDLRSQVPGGERGLVEEYVEKVPNPSLKTFKPIDLSDLKRRSTQDAKKS